MRTHLKSFFLRVVEGQTTNLSYSLQATLIFMRVLLSKVQKRPPPSLLSNVKVQLRREYQLSRTGRRFHLDAMNYADDALKRAPHARGVITTRDVG